MSRKGEERLRHGHSWVFGDDLREVPEGMPPGQWVRVLSRSGEFLGTATANLGCRLALRRVSRGEAIPSRVFFESRLRGALDRRAWAGMGDERALRLVHSEGDFLPGLVVDRYGGVLSVQFLTAGMESAREEILDALEGVHAPRLIYERSEGGGRRLEGLPERRGAVRGGGPPMEEVETDGVRFLVDAEAGPKTGFFLDQRENRKIVRRLADGADVLDGFCAAGGFGLYALAGGSRSVLAIDSSKAAVAAAGENAARNGCADRWRGEAADLFQALRDLSVSGRRFDLVVLDPPSFTKSREGRDGAIRGYRDINRLGMSVLSPGGLLATSSCTQLVDVAKWTEALRDAASDAGADLSLVAWGGQPPDHPVLLSVPETGYLKFAVYRKLAQ
ncbi:MAG: class I SAM-dependent rRNA methyltransferase [Deltaproteobacteria bacterium]|nr:class I SAM-dependent rRNA methyltransferase [Deltaproteobacteria bacterium]